MLLYYSLNLCLQTYWQWYLYHRFTFIFIYNSANVWAGIIIEIFHLQAVDKQKMTALHMAASHNEIEIVRMLIAEKAMLRCTDEEQATPLHYACMEGGVEIVKLLFEQCEMDNLYPTVSQV